MTLLPLEFPDSLLSVVVEFRSRVKRLLRGPGITFYLPYHPGHDLLVWWHANGEVGVGDSGGNQFDPILVTIDSARSPVTEWGTPAEITRMMDILRSAMVLDDLAAIDDVTSPSSNESMDA